MKRRTRTPEGRKPADSGCGIVRRRPTRRICAIVAASAFVAGAALAVLTTPDARAARTAARRGVLTLDDAGMRYAYQPLTGDESLFDLAADPHELHNLAATRPALVHRLRRELEERLHVDDLGALRASQARELRLLKSLGYL